MIRYSCILQIIFLIITENWSIVASTNGVLRLIFIKGRFVQKMAETETVKRIVASRVFTIVLNVWYIVKWKRIITDPDSEQEAQATENYGNAIVASRFSRIQRAKWQWNRSTPRCKMPIVVRSVF